MLPNDVRDREYKKFVEDGSGDVAVRNKISESALPSGAATSAKQDDIITELSQKLESSDISSLATSANQTNGTQQTKVKETAPTDATKVNDSLVLSYDGSNNLTTIAKTIDGVTYTKTLTYTGSNLTGVSSWS